MAVPPSSLSTARDWSPFPEVVRDGSRAERAGEPARPTRLLDRVRFAIRTRHYSRRTERAYIGWIRRFILFHDKRHPVEMSGAEVTRFLTHLAVDGKVSASTQTRH